MQTSDVYRSIARFGLFLAIVVEAFQLYTSGVFVATMLGIQSRNPLEWFWPLTVGGYATIVLAFIVQITLLSFIVPQLRRHHSSMLLIIGLGLLAIVDIYTDYMFIASVLPHSNVPFTILLTVLVTLVPFGLFDWSMRAGSGR